MSRFDKLRKFVIDKLDSTLGGETFYVQTARYEKGKFIGGLIGLFTGGGDELQVNPFTFFKGDGSEALVGTARARAAMSPAMELAHEFEHIGRQNIDGTTSYPDTAQAVALSFDEELAVVKDIDSAIAGHPDVAQRYWYGSNGRANQNLPGMRYVLAPDGDDYAEMKPNPTDKEWLRWPSKSVLSEGK